SLQTGPGWPHGGSPLPTLPAFLPPCYSRQWSLSWSPPRYPQWSVGADAVSAKYGMHFLVEVVGLVLVLLQSLYNSIIINISSFSTLEKGQGFIFHVLWSLHSVFFTHSMPEHWSYGVCRDGRVFFIDDLTRSTTWLHPRTEEPVNSGHMIRSDLPRGWEEGFSEEGASYFIE
ncbi:pleckstrin homology domain containing A7, partial [Chelydra serpentina]